MAQESTAEMLAAEESDEQGQERTGEDQRNVSAPTPRVGNDPPDWTPVMAWLSLPAGIGIAAAVGKLAGDGWALAAIFGTCFIFFFIIALWASPADIKGVLASLGIAALGSVLVASGMWFTAFLGSPKTEHDESPHHGEETTSTAALAGEQT